MTPEDTKTLIDAKTTELTVEFKDYLEDEQKLNPKWTRQEIFEYWSTEKIAYLTLAYENLIEGIKASAEVEQGNV